MRKLKFGGVAAIIAGAVVIVQSAAAVPPTTQTVAGPSTLTIPAGALCDFPILFGATVNFTVTTFFNEDGTIAMRHTQGDEQDTFTANGKTLAGDPYHVTFMRRFESGVSIDAKLVGVVERVQLPDGGVFIVAGNRDLLASPGGGGAIFAVDRGNSGNNIDAFCAALS